MAPTERKRQRAASDDDASNAPAKRPAHDSDDAEAADDAAVDVELASINDLLQEEETSQKQTWQIGKRVKKLLESNETLPVAKQLDAYFLWGTALARLASLNEDPTLADAAADKFQHMLKLSQGDAANEDAADAALGPVGFSLWGSSLLIVATETRSRELLDQALAKFERAVQVDGGTTFETRFQFAKALKEGGDLVAFLEQEEEGQANAKYYRRALQVCGELEEIYKLEMTKPEEEEHEEEGEGEDEDDDKVTAEDFAEAKLLEAVLQGLLEDAGSAEDFYRTLALYQAAIELNPESAEALMEMTNYLAARCLARDSLGAKPTAEEWTKLFDDLEGQYKRLLAEAAFDLQECHEICHRKDTHDQEEPEEEEIDERVPHLLNTLGKGLAAFVRSFPQLGDGAGEPSKKQKQKRKKSTGGARFTHAVEVLRSAHHFHDKLGGYYLACLYASPAFEDEEQCRTWLETADSYGSLEDEFDVQEFATMHEKAWFKRLAQPPEQIDDIDEPNVLIEEMFQENTPTKAANLNKISVVSDGELIVENPWQSEGDGYEWICSFLSGYDGDLIELELDEDGQHFFDNMTPLLAQATPSRLHTDDVCSSTPVQLTPFVLTVMSELQGMLQDSESRAGATPSRSYCVKLEEAQSSLDVVELRSRSFRRAVTTPRNRSRSRRHPVSAAPQAAPQDELSTRSNSKADSSSTSRQKINRRLF
ncbi:hypothetical protein PF005_g24741 [Phytophthora fragariae]|uniref:Uncharacterized protein n=1 Tax=Phytophthora fragariae TaxID=53985 RepID=A0A6A3RKM8_9STRA|nr:hypothetical protein PF009_g25519 [Phytophthora fragariae]KAE8977881.1 hypothetical protein PF011_g23471 [Phytophthora fragariae]KAE9075561.1 hypothetical protein PF010_g24254 [Phytophthora fragariae]KAE9095433.1 hypothetical protein PF006_g24015 [Phytophthora fragariae]KAE9119381.1 hypothetical protein PF007_g8560 [Phytophthora fragariae]